MKTRAKQVKRNELTSDCWSIQIWGVEYCKTCEYRDTSDCGGKAILEKIAREEYPEDGIGEEI